jgi:hypothetical protein
MFQDSRTDKVAYFGIWADGAGDQALRREALRLCQAATERCIDEDLRICTDKQAALDWLSCDGHGTAATRFRPAFHLPDPLEQASAVDRSLSYLQGQLRTQCGH